MSAARKLIIWEALDTLSVAPKNEPAANDNAIQALDDARENSRLGIFIFPHTSLPACEPANDGFAAGKSEAPRRIASEPGITGKEEDVEVGLQYFGKRYLNPLLGRWISADPLAVHAPGSADLNLYAYVSGHILKSVDPLGLQENDEGTGGGGDDDVASGEVEAAAQQPAAVEGAGGSNSYLESTEDAGTSYEGAPSEGTVRQGGEHGNVVEALPPWAQKTLAALGELPSFLNPFAATGDSVCQGSDCNGRQAQAALGDIASGAWALAKAGRALSASARKEILDDLDQIGTDVVDDIRNPVPDRMARVVEGDIEMESLGLGDGDVFVTAAEDIKGLDAPGLAERLTIPEADQFTVVEFDTPSTGVASPVNRSNPGFVGRGRTAGEAREFVVPNQPVPSNAVRRVVKSEP